MTFSGFLMVVGMVGAAFLVGVILRTLGLRETVRGAGIWLAALVFMGAVAAVTSARSPLIEPLWLHYVVFLAVPFAAGFVGLSLLVRGSRRR